MSAGGAVDNGLIAPADNDPQAVDPPADLADLPHLLAASTSGLAFIYDALDVLTARFGLRDAVVVVDDTVIGRQVFRVGRKPVGGHAAAGWIRTILSAGTGVYADPPLIDASTSAYLTSLVTLAIRLDMLHHDATHDALTGLLNRRSYELMLHQAVARTQRYGWPFALIVLDLDDFKRINDRLGHAAGDTALRSLGAALRQTLRGGDVAARVGGDEFALIIANGTATVLDPLIRRIEGALDRAAPGAGLRFSVGMACYPGDADDVDGLCRLADERLYAAKPAAR